MTGDVSESADASPTRPRLAWLHQRHPEMRPVGGVVSPTADHRTESRCVGPDFDADRSIVSTASSGGRSCVADQSTGTTHSGWSTLAMPTGRSTSTGTPAARNTACGPTPDSISRCADPIAPAHNTIRSAVKSAAPSAPTQDTPTARPSAIRMRPTRVLVSNVRLVRSHRRLQIRAAGANPGAAVDVQRHGPDTRRQRRLGRGAVEIVDPRVSRFGDGIHECCCTAIEFGDPSNQDRAVGTVQRVRRNPDRFRSP